MIVLPAMPPEQTASWLGILGAGFPDDPAYVPAHRSRLITQARVTATKDSSPWKSSTLRV